MNHIHAETPSHTLQTWPYLQEGDAIAIIAPACGSTDTVIEGGMEAIKRMGFTPLLPSTSLVGDDPFSSHDDHTRFEHLAWALQDPNIRAIWCLRGGYGATRLLPQLASLPRPTTPKPLIGFSDITALHTFLTQEWGWPVLHAPVLSHMVDKAIDDVHVRSVQSLLRGEKESTTITSLTPLNEHARKIKKIETTMTGGNICLIQHSLGTPWQLRPAGKILFLEEIDERGYRIDRMLTQLEQAHFFKDVHAIIFGDITGGEEPGGENLTHHALTRFSQHIDIPCLSSNGYGHGPVNLSLPFGTHSVLQLGEDAEVHIASGGKKNHAQYRS